MTEIIAATCIFISIVQLYWLWLQKKSMGLNRARHSEKAVSVIISARNEEENLKRLIPVLKAQKLNEEWEIIIVLDRCSDDSQLILEESKNSFSQLKYLIQEEVDIPPNHSPKKTALSKAIEKARYAIILQTDADCLPSSNYWISEMTASLAPGNVFSVGLSPYEKRKGLLNSLIQFDTAWTAGSMIYFATKGKPYMSLGRNQLFSKEYFLDKGGYGEGINISFGDDDLLLQKLKPGKKCDLCVTKKAQTVSIPKENFGDWLNQKRRHLMAGKHYSNAIGYKLILNYLSFPFYIFLMLWIALNPSLWYVPISFLLIRSLAYSSVFKSISEKSGSELAFVNIALMDLLHIYTIFGIWLSNLLRRNIRWE